MLNITINGQRHQVDEGTRVIAACRAAGIEVPTLCWLEGQAHFTSCMVCVVKDVRLGRLIPSCSAPVTDGMEIETSPWNCCSASMWATAVPPASGYVRHRLISRACSARSRLAI